MKSALKAANAIAAFNTLTLLHLFSRCFHFENKSPVCITLLIEIYLSNKY